jgi:hypothetical protein
MISTPKWTATRSSFIVRDTRLTIWAGLVLALVISQGCGPSLSDQRDALTEEVDELRDALRQANARIEQTAIDIDQARSCQVEPPEPVAEP